MVQTNDDTAVSFEGLILNTSTVMFIYLKTLIWYLRKNKHTVLTGANGSGKSTF